METEIYTIRIGLNNCYIIKQDGIIMVDAGIPDKIGLIEKQMIQFGINPPDIKLVVVSHAHFDHIGSLADLVKLTGAKVIVHKLEKTNLESGVSEVPKGTTGWGRFSIKLLSTKMKKIDVTGVVPDLIIEGDEFDLNNYGIRGRIIHTPGHTLGSVSVLLDDGNTFVGCMAHNRLPFTFRPRTPIFANHPEKLNTSWENILAKGAKTIYPGHGKAFPANKILKFLNHKLELRLVHG